MEEEKIITLGNLEKFKECLDNTKQDTLVSGENIKTINNQSILGEGNITIQGGGGMSTVVTDDTLDGDGSEENPLSVDVDNLGIEFPTETVGFICDDPLKFYEDENGRVHITIDVDSLKTLLDI